MTGENIYQIGDLIRVSALFTDAAGVAVDPTGIVAKYKNPANTITTLTYPTDAPLVKDSTGNYHVDIAVATTGIWYYRFTGTGAVTAADEHRFYVERSEF